MASNVTFLVQSKGKVKVTPVLLHHAMEQYKKEVPTHSSSHN